MTVTWDTDGRDLRLQVAERLGVEAAWADVTVALTSSPGNTAAT